MKWFVLALKNYADFNGRARRKEFWFFILFFYIAYFAAAALGAVFNVFWPVVIVALAGLVPALAVNVRRMHDTGHSGWFMFIPIFSLILQFTAGTPGANQYGNDPKQPELSDEIDMIGANPQP
jgi:uncharacterized membrane protein YhaH (DUF805 family)